MNFEDAVKKVRLDKDVGTIWYGFSVDNIHYFAVSPHKKVLLSDPESFVVIVSGNNIIKKKMFDMTNPKVIDGFSNKRFIDMNENDFNKIV